MRCGSSHPLIFFPKCCFSFPFFSVPRSIQLPTCCRFVTPVLSLAPPGPQGRFSLQFRHPVLFQFPGRNAPGIVFSRLSMFLSKGTSKEALFPFFWFFLAFSKPPLLLPGLEWVASSLFPLHFVFFPCFTLHWIYRCF